MKGAATRRPEETVKCGICMCGTEKEHLYYNQKMITLYLTIDENICTMYEYFDIFLGRMTMCSHAARIFGAKFSLNVNGQKVL